MKTKTQTIYIAEDNTEFLSPDECVTYEKNVLNRVNNMVAFSLLYSFDLTEGRGWNARKIILVENPGSIYNGPSAGAVVLQYVLQHHGMPIGEGVQGCGTMDAWILEEFDLIHEPNSRDIEGLKKTVSTSVGDYKRLAEWVLISNNPAPFHGITPILA